MKEKSRRMTINHRLIMSQEFIIIIINCRSSCNARIDIVTCDGEQNLLTNDKR